MNRLLIFIGCVVLAISCSRCKEDCDDATNPDCPNYVAPDPCADRGPVSAEFKIHQLYDLAPTPLYHEVLKIVCSEDSSGTSTVWIKANMGGLNYKWIIGQDTIYDSQYFFQFTREQCGGTFPVKLIVSGSVDSVCNPQDNGMDTVIKYIEVVHFREQEIFGRYKVSDVSAPNDSFEVSIGYKPEPGYPSNVIIQLAGFAPVSTVDTCEYYIIQSAYNFLKVPTPSTSIAACGTVRGQFYLSDTARLTADYEWRNPNISGSSLTPRSVRGRKIQ